jgi:hypothetical protein
MQEKGKSCELFAARDRPGKKPLKGHSTRPNTRTVKIGSAPRSV